jgi:hypothetical protein
MGSAWVLTPGQLHEIFALILPADKARLLARAHER